MRHTIIVFLLAAAGCSDKKPTEAQAAPPPVAPPPPSAPKVASISGKWNCMYSNKIGGASETIMIVQDGASVKVNVTGWDDANHNKYFGQGTGKLEGDTWNITYTWQSGGVPNWHKLKVSSDGQTLSGPRGKTNGDKDFDCDYTCTR